MLPFTDKSVQILIIFETCNLLWWDYDFSIILAFNLVITTVAVVQLDPIILIVQPCYIKVYASCCNL